MSIEFPVPDQLRRPAYWVDIPGDGARDLRPTVYHPNRDALSAFMTNYRCAQVYSGAMASSDASELFKDIMRQAECNFAIIHGATSLALSGLPLAYSGSFRGDQQEWINNFDVTLFTDNSEAVISGKTLISATEALVAQRDGANPFWQEYSTQRHYSKWPDVHPYLVVDYAKYGGRSDRAAHIRALPHNLDALEEFMRTYPRFYSTRLGYPLVCVFRDNDSFDTRIWNPFPVDPSAPHEVTITHPEDFADGVRNVLQVPRTIYFASHASVIANRPAHISEETLAVLAQTVANSAEIINATPKLGASLRKRIATTHDHAVSLDHYVSQDYFHLYGKTRFNFWEKHGLPCAIQHFKDVCEKVGLGPFLD